jgi:hypothetical protein
MSSDMVPVFEKKEVCKPRTLRVVDGRVRVAGGASGTVLQITQARFDS